MSARGTPLNRPWAEHQREAKNIILSETKSILKHYKLIIKQPTSDWRINHLAQEQYTLRCSINIGKNRRIVWPLFALRTHWNGNKCAMLKHTYDHDTRMISQVHKNSYDQEPEIDASLIRSAKTQSHKRTRQHRYTHMHVCLCVYDLRKNFKLVILNNKTNKFSFHW